MKSDEASCFFFTFVLLTSTFVIPSTFVIRASSFSSFVILMIDPEVLLQGYRLGVFPMAMEDGAIEWFSPDPRAILPLDKFHIPHTLERVIQKKTFEIRMDVAFAEVMQQCAQRPETWISGVIIESYTRLHQLGFFFNDTATTEIYTLSLHDALPISCADAGYLGVERRGEITTKAPGVEWQDRKSTRLNSSHTVISYAVFCLKKK